MDKKFIVTTNANTAEVLKRLGFSLISDTSERFVFLNNKNIVFSKFDDVVTTNILCC